MKIKNFIIIAFLLNVIISKEWIEITSSVQKSPNINVVDYDGSDSILEFELPGFNKQTVSINNQNYEVISFPTSAANLDYGYPDLPSISKSIIIPNDGLMTIEIVEQRFV